MNSCKVLTFRVILSLCLEIIVLISLKIRKIIFLKCESSFLQTGRIDVYFDDPSKSSFDIHALVWAPLLSLTYDLL